MGITRTDLFTEKQTDLAKVAKVFAHPARIAIVEHLLHAQVCINGDLVQELGLAQSTISQHLSELKEIGLIQGTIAGPSVSYCINPEVWTEIQSDLMNFFNQYEIQSNDCC